MAKARAAVVLTKILADQGKSDEIIDQCEKRLDYRRFYPALTGLWLALESAKSVKSVECDLLSRSNALSDRVRDLWTYRKDLMTTLEGIEVYDFIYGFIVPRLPCFSMERFQDWMPPGFRFGNDTVDFEWYILITSSSMHLNPADVLDLMRDPQFEMSPLKKQEYFLSRGLGDSRRQQRMQIRDESGEADDCFSVDDLEVGCVSKLSKRVKGSDSFRVTESRWSELRKEKWRHCIRCNFDTLESRCLELFSEIEQPQSC